jgi:ECF sigma factor
MMESHRVTELLVAATDGDAAAFQALFPLVYDALRRIAHRKLQASERAIRWRPRISSTRRT